MSPVRVRFAPSPTGYLHIGGLRTALYNYLLARKSGGTFVLRIEDTDRTRFVDDAEADLKQSMVWAGLTWDEGPDAGGESGPYHQSQRSELYARYAEQLVDSGHAYIAFDTTEEIAEMRTRLASKDNPAPRYDSVTRGSMRNSLSLSESEVNDLIASGAPRTVRLRVDPGSEIAFEDEVRGRVVFASAEVDDQVLVKSDGMPTYHLANVVDDHHMAITHVIRGEEWLPSTPKHILLYQALGWEAPTMAHLPLILSPTGGKLSKRSADRHGIPVLVKDYETAGFEPEAVVNYLAFLGWNPGDEREIFGLDELVDAFSLDRVGSAGVQFDADKLKWYNGQHLRRTSIEELTSRAADLFASENRAVSSDVLAQVVALMQDRITYLRDMITETTYFFDDPAEYDAVGIKKRWKPDSASLLTQYADALESEADWTATAAEAVLRNIAEAAEAGAGRIIHPVRLAVSGVTFGPGVFDLLEVLGRDVVVRRLRKAVAVLG